MSDGDLLPCPFCGDGAWFSGYVVQCNSCGAQLICQERGAAIPAWNRRHLSAEVKGLREALEKAAQQFRFYEREHQAKADAVYAVSGPGRDEYEKRRAKATTNKTFADLCESALFPTTGG